MMEWNDGRGPTYVDTRHLTPEQVAEGLDIIGLCSGCVAILSEAMLVACPSCCVAYENNQKISAKAVQSSLAIPVLYYTQLIGLSMEISEKELGFEFNRIPFKVPSKERG